MVLRVARLRDFADTRGQILADAGNLAKARLVELRELVRMVRRGVGAVSIRADLERVVVPDLQKIGDLPEDARDRRVIQSAALRSRCGSPGSARRQPPAPRQSADARSEARNRTDTRRRP